MVVTDPIADLLTRIRNAISVKKEVVDIPHSKAKEKIVSILKEEGYINDYRITDDAHWKTIRVYLKYYEGRSVINELTRKSTPGRRVYVGVEGIPQVKNGIGISILSTSKGIVAGSFAASQKVGGELICTVW